MEHWREIPGFEGVFAVSTRGRIKRLQSRTNVKAGQIRKDQRHSQNYRCIWLTGGGRREQWLVHRLVLRAFVGPPPKGRPEVNHKDGNRTNNSLCNLEYVSPKANVAHARQVLGYSNAGELHSSSKLTADQVREIRRRRASGEELLLLANAFGISFQHVSDIALRKRWVHI